MIKKFCFLFLIIALLIPAFSMAAYERAMRITVREVVDHMNNFVLIQNNYESYLIHHQRGCGSVQDGDELTLVIRGELDGNQDELWKGSTYRCVVDQAELITGTLRVTTVSAADNYTSVSDNGTPYRIYYSERCKAMKGMNGKDVYVRKFGGALLRVGDKFFLPGAGEMCSITYVQPEGIVPPEPKTVTGDIKRPTTPTHFRAIPSGTAVYLYWDAAKDDAGIAYYVISASLYHRDDPVARDPDLKPQEMPDTIKTPTNKNSLRLDDLQPDELYFFRVIAVDTSGNESSYWSEEATAFTKSSIAQISLQSSVLRLFQSQETAGSFLFRWNSIPSARYSVILTVDGQRVFTSNNWTQTYIRILKDPSRKNKDMKLTVRSLDFRGNIQEAVARFRF